jgi:hypothetical protein
MTTHEKSYAVAPVPVTSSASAFASAAVHDAIARKIRRRLLPLLFVLYVVAYLDRINVGFAALRLIHQGPHRVRIIQQRCWMIREFSQCDLGTRREWMGGMHYRNDGASQRLDLLDIGMGWRLETDRDIAFFRGQRGNGPGSASHLHFIGDSGVRARKLRHGTVHNTGDGKLDTGDPYRAAPELLQIIDFRVQTLEIPYGRPRLPGEDLSCHREAHTRRMPLEQRHAIRPLEQRDLPANRRWGDV